MRKIYNKILLQSDDTSISGGTATNDTSTASEELSGFDLDFQDLYSDTPIDSEEASESTEDEDGEKEGGEVTGEESTTQDTVEGATSEESSTETTSIETTAPPAEESPDKIADLEAQIAKLTSTIETLTKAPVAEPTQVKPIPKPEPEITSVNLLEAFKDLDLESAMESKEGFLDFLGKALLLSKKDIINTMPEVIDTVVTQKSSLESIRDKFYENNPIFTPIKPYVGQVAQQISAADPTKNLEAVLEETARVVKETLGLKDIEAPIQTTQTTDSKDTKIEGKPKPVLPGATSKPRQESKGLTKLQEDIEEFLED